MDGMWDRYRDLVGVRYPVVQDGMGPAPCTELAAAVSSAGGLGTLSSPSLFGTAADQRARMRAAVERIGAVGSGPFAVNVPVGRLGDGTMLPVSEVCIDETIAVKRDGGPVADRLVALTTSAGFPGEFSERIRASGLVHQHKVGSLRQAVKAAGNGADVVIASGYEMGGHTHHRGVHTMVLAPQVIAALDRPVVVSGGLHDGRGLAAVLAMGGAAVAMGTRFIASAEHEWHSRYKQRVVDSPEQADVVYPGFYAPVRGLPSRGLDELDDVRARLSEQDVGAWKEERMCAAQLDGDVDDGLVVAGQVAAAVLDIPPVAEIIGRMVEQAEHLLGAAASSGTGAPVPHG
jgi:enoyl-[acyl-carrier protein] reductase II